MDSTRDALADGLLGSVMEEVVPAELAASTGRLQKAGGQGVVGPLELLRELADALVCRRCGQRMALPTGGKRVLERMRDAVLKHANDIVVSQGRPGALVRRQLAACCMVFPLLLTPDAAWNHETTGSLPTRLRSGLWVGECERFALHAGRPRTALHLSSPHVSAANTTPELAVPYLLKAAQRMAAERDYAAEVACLQAALGLAREHGDAKRISEVAFLTAERLADYGGPVEAAAFLKETMEGKPLPEDIGRLHILRLTCLYKAKQYKAVATETNLCLEDDRYPRRGTQLLYLAWAACRRVGEHEKSSALGARFLKSYPTHPLAADVLYANAMGALAQAEYKKAHGVLSRIAREFPDSRVGGRVEKLLKRLAPLMEETQSKQPAQ